MPSRTMLGADAGAMAVRAAGDARSATLDGARPAGADVRARHGDAPTPNGRFSMDKWDGYAASRNRLYARLRETKAPNPIVLSGDVHVALRRRPEGGLHATRRSRDGRRRVHEHVGHVRRRRQRRRRPTWEAIRPRQPAHQVPQRPARLHRLHGDAGADARGFQGARSGHGARRAGSHRRLARRRGGTPGRVRRLVPGNVIRHIIPGRGIPSPPQRAPTARRGPGLAALLLPHMGPLCSVVAPCHPGAALRDSCNESRFQGTIGSR